MAESEKITLSIRRTDDYRGGPKVWIIDDDEESEWEVTIDPPQAHKYRVYYIGLGIGEVKVTSLRSFDSYENARGYCQAQFKLTTQEDPFCAEGGMTAGYHPTGKRTKIQFKSDYQITYDAQNEEHVSDIKDYDCSNFYHALLIDNSREVIPLEYDYIWYD